MREFPYKWIRFEAFLFLFELFQFICELSVLRMRKGRFVHKMYIILYFVFESFNSEASVAILRVGSDCSAYCLYSNSVRQINRGRWSLPPFSAQELLQRSQSVM